MRKWLANSDSNCKSGFTETALKILQQKAAAKKSAGSQLVCTLSFDEMHIRKQVIWCNELKRLLGYADFHNDQQEVPVATNVIVYMVTGINEHFSIPVAYYFVKSMDALQKKETLLGVIDQLIDRDVLIFNITFDGHSSNKGMCRLLGANLNVFSKSFQPYFVAREKKIYILFDPCHMPKLVRNTLGKLKVIIDGEGGKVMWRYFEQIVRFGRKKELGLTHKLN